MIKSFVVGIKHHVNLGDYESMEVETSVTMEINKPDEFGPARIVAQDVLEVLQEETFEAQHKPKWFERIMTKQRKKTQNIQQITENAR